MSGNSERSFRFEKSEDGAYGIMAVAWDVQVGWCRAQHDGWLIFDMDESLIGGPFPDIASAERASALLLVDFAAASNPGH
jgi:hypothetical protein